MNEIQILIINESDINEYLEEETINWKNLSVLPIEQGFSQTTDDAYAWFKKFWKEKLCDIDYQKHFLIVFYAESFYEIWRSTELGSGRKKSSKKIGTTDKKEVISLFKAFMKIFRENLNIGQGEAWHEIRYNWRGDT